MIGPGCKWTLRQLQTWVETMHPNGRELYQNVWDRIVNIVNLTSFMLLTMVPSVPSSGCFFELFGFDIMIDSDWHPWLLEVNCSPALTMVRLGVARGYRLVTATTQATMSHATLTGTPLILTGLRRRRASQGAPHLGPLSGPGPQQGTRGAPTSPRHPPPACPPEGAPARTVMPPLVPEAGEAPTRAGSQEAVQLS